MLNLSSSYRPIDRSRNSCLLLGYHADLVPDSEKLDGQFREWSTATWKVENLQKFFHRQHGLEYLPFLRPLEEEPVDHDQSKFLLDVEIRRKSGKVTAEVCQRTGI